LNRAKCALCKDVIVSKHRHDFVSCTCGEIFVDGGNDYWRAGAKDVQNLLRFKNRKWTATFVEPVEEMFQVKKTFWQKVKERFTFKKGV